MTLNFLRVKAIHDDFTLKFGIVNLPLKFELKRKAVKIFKRKFTPDPNIIYEERASESNSVRKKDSDVVKIRKGSLEYQFAKSLLLRRTTGFSRFSNVNLNFEEVKCFSFLFILLTNFLLLYGLFSLRKAFCVSSRNS